MQEIKNMVQWLTKGRTKNLRIPQNRSNLMVTHPNDSDISIKVLISFSLPLGSIRNTPVDCDKMAHWVQEQKKEILAKISVLHRLWLLDTHNAELPQSKEFQLN